MRRFTIALLIVSAAILVSSSFSSMAQQTGATPAPAEQSALAADNQDDEFYACAMHPDVMSDKPGKCPKCGMTLVRTRRSAAGAHALLRADDGRWVMIEAAPLEGGADAQIAVTLRSATAGETFDLLCRAYALSRREREVVEALLAGLDTRALAQRLSISRHTVQDHLKSVFEKLGVHSRRELLAKFNVSANGR